jgi:hypothetical protein
MQKVCQVWACYIDLVQSDLGSISQKVWPVILYDLPEDACDQQVASGIPTSFLLSAHVSNFVTNTKMMRAAKPSLFLSPGMKTCGWCYGFMIQAHLHSVQTFTCEK